MGNYLTSEEMAKQAGYKQIRQLTNHRDEVQPLDEDFREAVKATPGDYVGDAGQQDAAVNAVARINIAIDQAESRIDAALSMQGYTTPIASPEQIMSWATFWLAYESLHVQTELSESAQRNADSAAQWLEKLHEGKASLDQSPDSTEAVPVVRARDEVFTEDLLNSMPG